MMMNNRFNMQLCHQERASLRTHMNVGRNKPQVEMTVAAVQQEVLLTPRYFSDSQLIELIYMACCLGQIEEA